VFGAYPCVAGTEDTLADANGILGTGVYTNTSRYTMAMIDNVGTDYLYAEGTASGSNAFNIRINTTDYISSPGNTGTNEISTPITNLNVSDHTYYLLSEVGSTTNDGDGGIGQVIKKDGRRFATGATDATFSSFTGNNSQARLSGSQSGGSDTNNIHGRVGEVIVYAQNTVQTASEQQRIETYMALKYGKTLSNVDTLAGIDEGKYVLSNGTTFVWDGSLPSGADRMFHYNVAGIGRDDVSDLYQKIGRSINNDEMLTIALDNNFTVANSDAARVGTFATDLDYIMWGHQGGSHLFDTAVSTANTNTRLGRYWKVKMTGIASKSVNLQFSNPNVLRLKNGQQYVLLESASATFASPVELATASATASGTTSAVSFAGVTLTSGKYYTIGTRMIAPG
jgi:trimeric autotransporter adhesin